MVKKARAPRTATLTVAEQVVAMDSDYDEITASARRYRDAEIYPQLEAEGFELVHRQGRMARRHWIVRSATQSGTRFLTGVGHGQPDTFTGDMGMPVFEVEGYPQGAVHGRVVHLLSCQTAIELGPAMVEDGCLAFFGYDRNFIAYTDERFADIFWECDGEIDRALAEGNSAGEAYRRAFELYDAYSEALRDAGHDAVAAALEFDRDHLMAPSVDPMFGDTDARL